MNHSMGDDIYNLRKESGMTQSQLAEKVHVSAQAVSKWETGESNPDIALIPELAKVLGTTVGVLFGDKEPKQRPVSHYSLHYTTTVVSFAFTFLALVSLSTAFFANWDKLIYSQVWIALSLGLLVVSLVVGIFLGSYCLKRYTSR